MKANERLLGLTQQKTYELTTNDYYGWLFCILQSAAPESHIWAISMMLEVEWDESPAEAAYLQLNLNAANRGVFVERIFVVRQRDVSGLLSNRAVKAQLDNAGEFLIPLLVEREYLESHDPELVKQLGEGLIAVEAHVALVDISSSEDIRGYVTMNPTEIAYLRRIYENLRVHACPMADIIHAPPKTIPQS